MTASFSDVPLDERARTEILTLGRARVPRAELHRQLRDRRRELLAARDERQAELAERWDSRLPPRDREIREG